MTAGVVLLGFGEPPSADRDRVVDYLERIFLANAAIEDRPDPEARASDLAARRAPGLLEEYEAIGGSPLIEQLHAHADRLEAELDDRGLPAVTAVGCQYTEPFIEDAVSAVRERAVDRVIGLPVYPLCGASTTIASLAELRAAIDDAGWDVPVHELTGWHPHPTYNRLRAENLAGFCEDRGVRLDDDGVRLVFSAHGTPQHYLDGGSRYDRYVASYCGSIASLLGVDGYEIGYQNHENRDVAWTEPPVEAVIDRVDAEAVVIDPVSFMHEQSETLAELDRDLRADAESRGLAFHRVPVPHDDPRFPGVLADLVEPFVAGFDPGYYNLAGCRCRDSANAVCLNATGPVDQG